MTPLLSLQVSAGVAQHTDSSEDEVLCLLSQSVFVSATSFSVLLHHVADDVFESEVLGS